MSTETPQGPADTFSEGVYIELTSVATESQFITLLSPHFNVKRSLEGGIIVQETEPITDNSPHERLTQLIQQVNEISPASIVEDRWTGLPLLVALRKAKILKNLVPLHTARDAMSGALRYMRIKDERTEIDRLANYAGEQTSLYFMFIRTYRNWLVVPAVFSVFFSVFPGNFQEIDLAPAVLAWASAFLSFGWKPLRKRVKTRPGGASLQLLGYHTEPRRVLRGFFSFFLYVSFVVLSVSLLFYTLNAKRLDPLPPLVRTVLFTLVSQSLGSLVDPVARKLTSWEHHGDDLNYDKSRISKAVILKLALFFPFPIHLAFRAENPVAAIQTHLATTFTVKQIIQSLTEMTPWLRTCFEAKKAPLEPWSGDVWTTNDEYLEMGIQFATLMAFGFMWPLSFALAFANNVFEGVLDAKKLSLCRRPFPSNTDVNKLWYRTFRVLTLVGASVNVALLLKLGERSRQTALTHFFALIAVAVLGIRGVRDLNKLLQQKKRKHD